MATKPLTALDYLAHAAKHPPRPVCVVYGDESFLKRRVLAEIRKAVFGENASDQDFSLTTFEGEKADPRDVFDELSTAALFGGGQRMVIVSEADDFVSENRTLLEDYVARPKPTGVLVLDVKTWPSNTRLYKATAETGLQIECKPPGEAELLRWAAQWTKQTHRAQLAPAAAERLVEIVGPIMGLLDQELARLALMAGEGGSITLELVDETVGGWRAKTGWELVDQALDGNAAEALRQLERLLLAGEHPVALLGQIGGTLRRFAAAVRLLEQAEAAGRRMSPRDALVAAGFKTWPAAIQKAERQFRQLGRQRSRQLQRWLLDADLALKGTSSHPARARLVLEELIARLSTQAAPAAVS